MCVSVGRFRTAEWSAIRRIPSGKARKALCRARSWGVPRCAATGPEILERAGAATSSRLRMTVAPRDWSAIEMVVSACSQPLLGRAADAISSRACAIRSGLSIASQGSKRCSACEISRCRIGRRRRTNLDALHHKIKFEIYLKECRDIMLSE